MHIRRNRPQRLVAGLLFAAMLSTACGTTAYRDRLAIENGDLTTVAGGAAAVPSPTPGAGDDASSETATSSAVAGGATSTSSGTSIGSSSTGSVGSSSGSSGSSGTSTTGGTTPSGSTSSGTTTSGGASTAGGATDGGTTGGSDQGGTTSGGTTSGGTTSGGASGGTSGGGNDGGGTGGTTTRTEPDERGLTADTINIGFVRLGSFRALSDSLGFTNSETGDVDGQIEALVDWVNANGGIAGRQVNFQIREYTQEEASPQEEQTICTAFSQDFEAWAVVLQGQIHQSTRECYAREGVTTIDPSPFTFDDDLFTSLSPFYFNPVYPSYDKVARTLVPSLDEQGFWEPVAGRPSDLNPIKTGVLHFNHDSARRVLNDDMRPALQAIGRDADVTYEVDSTNAGTIQAGLSDAVTAFQTQNVNRVLFIGGSPLAPFFFLNADNRNFRPRYGMSTIDAPRNTTEQQWADQLLDALGIGFNPVNDVFDDKHQFPGNATESLCLDIMAAAGHTFERRQGAQSGLAYCEALFLLDTAGEAAGVNLSHVTFAREVEALGDSFETATALGTTFGPGRHDGGSLWRTITFDNASMVWDYTSGDRPFR